MINHVGNVYVGGSNARHTPFGDYRPNSTPTADNTDMGFTGHRENRDIGLTYMNARFYVGGIGRFASADTIIPDPTNPQSFNRFAYVYNNPLNLIDPSGHFGCTPGGYLEEECSEQQNPKYEKYDKYDEEYTATANGIGLKQSASGHTGLLTVVASMGVELTWDDDEIVLFVVPGLGINLGVDENAVTGFFDERGLPYSTSTSFYVAKIYNTENLEDDYCCSFSERGVTLATPTLGFNGGQAAAPEEINIPHLDRESSYSHTLGPSTGLALSVDSSESYYVPVWSADISNGFSGAIVPYAEFRDHVGGTLSRVWEVISGLNKNS